MTNILAIVILVLGFTAQTAHAGGSISSPETRGWVMEDGRYVNFWQSRAGLAATAKAAAEKAAKQADIDDRPQLARHYIAKYGESQWKSFGSWKSTADLRKMLSVVGVVAIVGASVGVSENAQAASVRMQPNPSSAATQEPTPGTTASSYQTYGAPARNTAK